MRLRHLIPLMLALLGQAGLAAPASAQYEADQGTDHWSRPASRATDSPGSLQDARSTGRGITLTGYGGRRHVPDIYRVRRGDTLWDITGRYYGTPWQWPRVWSYNPEVTNPHWIYPDDHLRLRPAGQIGRLPEGGGRPTRVPPETVFLRDEGYLDREALEASAVIIGSPEEQMLLASWDEVYVRFDDETEVRPGSEYTIYREIEDDERNSDEDGVLVRIFGTVRLRNYDRDRQIGRAVITEALDPIERGYRIASIPRRFEMVPPVPNDRDTQGEVVAALRPRSFHADQQIVFVDLGEEAGLRLGNRLFVVREADEWRRTFDDLGQGERYVGEHFPNADRPDEYPPEIIAEGRVVSLRPNTAALMVTRSVREVVIGDRVEMRQGF